MLENSTEIIGLTRDECRLRQRRLIEGLQRDGIDKILIADRRHVYYFSGYWGASHHVPLMILTKDGVSHLVLPIQVATEQLAAESVSLYESHHLGTLIDDEFGAALRPLETELQKPGVVATDLPGLAPILKSPIRQASPLILEVRRAKEKDEVALIRCAIRACEAAYARAAVFARPGIREIDVYAEMLSAAIKELGEPIGELGNDFQAGTPGGPPRKREIRRGELMPLDVSVSVRGYRCDLCRTFAIGGEPTRDQLEAAQLVENALRYVEDNARIGISCRQLFDDVSKQLDGRHGWQFFHHLGHGIGLSPHEAPRLNPFWDDYLKAGDVFTVEPGLYGESLRAGVRIEQNYWISPDGICRLSSYPTELS